MDFSENSSWNKTLTKDLGPEFALSVRVDMSHLSASVQEFVDASGIIHKPLPNSRNKKEGSSPNKNMQRNVGVSFSPALIDLDDPSHPTAVVADHCSDGHAAGNSTGATSVQQPHVGGHGVRHEFVARNLVDPALTYARAGLTLQYDKVANIATDWSTIEQLRVEDLERAGVRAPHYRRQVLNVLPVRTRGERSRAYPIELVKDISQGHKSLDG
jgi:hypothetical protein